jgi:hypothetical protein
MKTTWTLTAALLALAATATPARADSLDDLRTDVRLQVTRAVAKKVVAKLALDDASARRFTELAERYALRLDSARQQLKRDYGELHRLVDADADAAALDAASSRVVEDQAEVNRVLDERARATRKTLTARQFAELVLFWPQINRMLADEIESARGGK